MWRLIRHDEYFAGKGKLQYRGVIRKLTILGFHNWISPFTIFVNKSQFM